MSDIDLVAVVKKLIGSIEPVGESHTDKKRLENLKEMTALIEELMHEVNGVAHNKSRHEDSMKQIGKHADGFIKYLVKEYAYSEDDE